MSAEITQRLDEMQTRLDAMSDAVHLESSEGRMRELEAKMSQPGFWSNKEEAQAVHQELKRLRDETEPVKRLLRSVRDLRELAELASAETDEATLGAVLRDCQALQRELEDVELKATLSGKHDKHGAFVSIHAGAGGTESCDWAAMLLRMYTRWAEDQGYRSSLVDVLDGEEAGIRSATLKIDGSYAYGYLKSEIGVHRLVRISPFDSKARRHTSFSSVDAAPDLPDDIDVAINPADLRVDTFRAGGAGGQHVNRTDSAVRITHVPTGIVVQCQNERSQHSNRAQAMKVLKARLIQLEEAKREAELAQLYSEKGEIAWGNQIRSYVLQPYQMVKDHRTGCEVGNAQGVLDGKLGPFMEAYLRHKRKEGGKGSRAPGVDAAPAS
jgi:peptide chain release factor 2